MNTLDELNKEIEFLRQEMYASADRHDGNHLHPSVVAASQRLDRALDAYDRFLKQQREAFPKKKLNDVPIYRVDLKKVSFVKKAVQSALALDQDPQEVHNTLIEIYWRFFKELGQTLYFKLAMEHITAYLTTGLKTGALTPVAEEILVQAGYRSIGDYLHTIGYSFGKFYVKLTRNRISTILGKGSVTKPASGLTRNAIIDDILEKIWMREIGNYCYEVNYKDRVSLSYLTIKDASEIYMQDNSGNQFKFIDLPTIKK